MSNLNEFRVKLVNSADRSETVIFDATPDLIETRNVNYKTVDPIHAPGQTLAYVNTASRSFDLSSIKLMSRTREEAERNLIYLWILRSWTMPTFGKDTLTSSQKNARKSILQSLRNKRALTEIERRRVLNAVKTFSDIYGVNNLGTPPAVLLLSAYSPDKQDVKAHINQVPVVIQNISIPYPIDVDYFPSLKSNIPMPTVMTINMTLTETHSPREYGNFDLTKFKQGILENF